MRGRLHREGTGCSVEGAAPLEIAGTRVEVDCFGEDEGAGYFSQLSLLIEG